MEYIKENQILLYEELCAKPVDESDLRVKTTIRFRNNIKLAHHISKNFSRSYDGVLDHEDIVQEAYLGLWKACLSYDESTGFTFATYAVPTIKGQILRALRDNGAIKESRTLKDIRQALIHHGFTLPLTDEEVDVLVEEGKFSRAQILNYVDVHVISIDEQVVNKKGDSRPLAEYIPDPTQDVESKFSDDEIEHIIDLIVQYIKPKSRDMVEEWMYSVLAGEKVDQHTLANKYNLSQAQVSRTIRAAIDIVKMHGEEIRTLFGF